MRMRVAQCPNQWSVAPAAAVRAVSLHRFSLDRACLVYPRFCLPDSRQLAVISGQVVDRPNERSACLRNYCPGSCLLPSSLFTIPSNQSGPCSQSCPHTRHIDKQLTVFLLPLDPSHLTLTYPSLRSYRSPFYIPGMMSTLDLT